MASQQYLSEGSARILLPAGLASASAAPSAFYNPAQVINRDLSVCAAHLECRAGEEPPCLLEALSATGLRSIRYRKEAPLLGPILANDLSEQAVLQIQQNLLLNEVQDSVQSRQGDCAQLMSPSPATTTSWTWTPTAPPPPSWTPQCRA